MRLTVILGCLAGLNVLLAFFYQWYVLATLGPGIETDALFAAIAVPQILLAVLSGALVQVLVPLLSVLNATDFQKAAWNFFQAVGLICSLFGLLLFVTAPEWVPWTVPGFDSSTQLLTVKLVRIQLVGTVFMGLNGVAWSAYHSRQRFIWTEISQVLGTLSGFAFLVWGVSRLGIAAAAWAMVIRSATQMVLSLPAMGAYRLPGWQDDKLKEAWRQLYPLLLGTSYYKTGELVDRFLASLAPPGQLSLLHFANQVYLAGNLILSKAFALPMVPLLAKASAEQKWFMFRETSHNRFLWVLGISIGVWIGIFVLGPSFYPFFFGQGRFTIDDAQTFHYILLGLAGVWVGGAVGQTLASSFYAKGNTRTPTKIGVFGFTLGLGFKVAGFCLWGVLGIAVGTSLYYLINAFLLKFLLSRQLKRRLAEVSQGV